MEVFGIVLLVLGLIGAGLLNKHLREAKQLKLRQIIHEERMKALETGTPLPEADDASLMGQYAMIPADPAGASEHHLALAITWTRITALFVGLACMLGGIAVSIAMYLIDDPEFFTYWPVGLIPLMLGAGLLIFYAMTPSRARPPSQ